jgi:hypothetical protein
LSYRTITIPAAVGGKPGIWIEPFPARVFFCVAATGNFNVGTDGNLPSPMSQGRGFGSANSLKFLQLVFTNDGSAEVVVTAWIADKEFASLAGVQSSVVTVQPEGVFIWDGSNYPGIPGGLNPPADIGLCTIPVSGTIDILQEILIGSFVYQRVGFQVTNTTEGKDLRLMTIYSGFNGRVVDLIRGGTTRFFGAEYTSQSWRLQNNTSSAIVCPITLFMKQTPVSLG